MRLGHLIALICNAHPRSDRLHTFYRIHPTSPISADKHCNLHSRKTSFHQDTPSLRPRGYAIDGPLRATTDLWLLSPWVYPFFTMSSSRRYDPAENVLFHMDTDAGGSTPPFEVKSGGARRDRTDDLMLAKHALSQLSYGPISLTNTAAGVLPANRHKSVVGLGRFELPTSRLSSARSNQLSYRPNSRKGMCAVCVHVKKEKRRRRCPAEIMKTAIQTGSM